MQTSVFVIALVVCVSAVFEFAFTDSPEFSLADTFLLMRLRRPGLTPGSNRVILMLLREECLQLLQVGGIGALHDYCVFVLSNS
ncbi:hypothetical protein BsWGS_01728 [Bradybaena similaris]